MKNLKYILFFFLFDILVLTACSTKTASYTYNTNSIKHPEDLYITQTTYYSDRVEIDFNYKYSMDYFTFGTPGVSDSKFFTDKKTLIITTDSPLLITSLNVYNDYMQAEYRYLNSDKYACIYRYWADDLGWLEDEGDKDRFYTDEEKKQRKEIQDELAERRKFAEIEDEEVFQILKGKWVADNGEYFDIFEHEDHHGFLHYMPNVKGGFEEWPYITMYKVDEALGKYGMNYSEGWGVNVDYDVILSEDGNSFIYEANTFYRADEDLWADVDIRYIHPIRILFENSDIWDFTEEEADDVSDEDDLNVTDTDDVPDENDPNEMSSDSDVKTVAEGIKYAVTDLDDNGCPEIIVSGHSGDEQIGYSYIYEVKEDGTIKPINSNSLKDRAFLEYPPNLYLTDSCERVSTPEGYKYVVYASADQGYDVFLKKNYLLSIQYDSAVIEKDNSADLQGYHDTVNFFWFDDITLENMAESIRVFTDIEEIE